MSIPFDSIPFNANSHSADFHFIGSTHKLSMRRLTFLLFKPSCLNFPFLFLSADAVQIDLDRNDIQSLFLERLHLLLSTFRSDYSSPEVGIQSLRCLLVKLIRETLGQRQILKKNKETDFDIRLETFL